MGAHAITLWSTSVSAAVAIACVGCDDCGGGRPYTPFVVQSSTGLTSPPPSASAVTKAALADARPGFSPEKAALAPKDAQHWNLSGLELTAPEGHVFERGLAADFDADQKLDAVAWVLPTAADDLHGELWFYGGGTGTRRIAKLPGYIPTGPGCALATELTRTGPKTVTLDISARCEGRLIARSPVRAVIVLAPGDSRATILALRVAESAPRERMALAVESADRDNDGRDDVRLSVEVAREGSEKSAIADFVWLDRPAGPSRDPTEPAKSLSDLASVEVVRANGRNTAAQVPERIENVRRLYADVCGEGGVPRLFDADGAALTCGDLARVFEWLTTAELRAAVARGDLLEAFGVLSRHAWYHAPLPESVRAKLERELTEHVVVRTVAMPVTVEPIPRAASGAPRWSPLRFEPGGTLLVQTANSIERVDASGHSTGHVEEEVDAWPMTVTGPGDLRWVGMSTPCDRAEVMMLQTAASGAPVPPEPIALLAPRPGACGRGAGPQVPTPTPVHWSAEIRAGIFAGSLFGATGALPATTMPGAPRSPDGKRLVVPTSYGILVLGGEKPQLWKGDVLGATSTFSDCVVANEAAAVACIRHDRASLIKPAP